MQSQDPWILVHYIYTEIFQISNENKSSVSDHLYRNSFFKKVLQIVYVQLAKA